MLTGLATGETELPADDVSEVVSMNVTNLNFTARFFQAHFALQQQSNFLCKKLYITDNTFDLLKGPGQEACIASVK